MLLICLLCVRVIAVAQQPPIQSVPSIPTDTASLTSIDTSSASISINNIDTSSVTSSDINDIDTLSSLTSSGIDSIDNIDTSAAPPKQRQNIKYIRGIEIYGNVTTRPEILRYYFAFDTGEVLDTSKLRLTRANLLATQLYDKVDIFPHFREDGAHVFIILKESVRLDIGYGIEYSTRKYGESELWYSVHVDAAVNNFRGRMETFWFGVSALERLGFDLSWHKPFLPTPYYMTLSAGVAEYPDDALPVNYIDTYGKLAVGRKVLANSRVFVSAMPIYRYRDTVPEYPKIGIASPERHDFFEAFAVVGFATDRRSARFDPKSGWLLNTQLSTNYPYNGVNDSPFFQSTNEFRYYVPLVNDIAAFRVLLTLRDTDAGEYHRLSYGSAGDIRGYANKALGWNFSTQSSILASVKYHKPLYTTPELPMPLINTLFKGVNDLSFRIDGTLIADAAMLYRDPLGALTQRGLGDPKKTQPGLAFGFGTRILAPRVRQSGCIDLVFGRTETEPDNNEYQWEPALHLYLDLFY